jgi:hypothetical protein
VAPGTTRAPVSTSTQPATTSTQLATTSTQPATTSDSGTNTDNPDCQEAIDAKQRIIEGLERKVHSLEKNLTMHRRRKQPGDNKYEGPRRDASVCKTPQSASLLAETWACVANNCSKVVKTEPFFKDSKIGSAKAADLENAVAASSAAFTASMVKGDAPDWTPLAELGFKTDKFAHPGLAFFSALFMGHMKGDSEEKLIKSILTDTENKVSNQTIPFLGSKLDDIREELKWVPGMLQKEAIGEDCRGDPDASYWLLISHDLATKRSNVFNADCIKTKPWRKVKQPNPSETTKSHLLTGPGLGLTINITSENKRSGNSCDKWVEGGKTVELMWTYANLHMAAMSQIVLNTPSFKSVIAHRILDKSHQYAGLLKQAYESFIPYRLAMIQNCRDDYLKSDISMQTGDCDAARKEYKDKISKKLQNDGNSRIAKIYCYGIAAATGSTSSCAQ